ncbi:MAG: VWA domain-containing protein [Gammaproteobacteria bacterium]|nr:VWA domain-containing protein [Gammaproteobacteria bacterium]
MLPASASDSPLSVKPIDPSPVKNIKIKAITDLRVLVDISGSMKKTDPNNLRRPAIRLLAGLIPDDSRSGIWNFGKQVNMTVKIGAVNDAWRNAAREQSKEISSAGLYTNIENAMRRASFDWKEPDPKYKRNLILLTDGHVDISQDEKVDEASRKRILKEVLPLLEKAKVKIHTIALSDDVDENLLSTLSSYTDGLYRKVSSAEDLQKLFLQMLEQSVELDTLPIEDNRFNVDANINDMTLLVFNKDKEKPTSIVTPGKKTWSSKSQNDQIKWFSDDGYDLITIKKPQQGQWKIMAPVDENNRVVVATNLKLKINELPAFSMLGDVINVNAQLEEDGKQLTDQRLLSKFNFTLKRKKEGADEQLYPMSKRADNQTIYSIQLPPMFKPGDNAFVIQAKSPTAEREIHHQLTVYDVPANVKITDENETYQVIVIPHNNLLRPDSIKITLETEDKSKYALAQRGKEWTFNIDKKYKNKLLTINIDAVRADGQPFVVSFNKVLVASGESQELVLDVKKESAQVQEITKEKVTQTKDTENIDRHKNEEESQLKEKQDEINWTLIMVSIVIGNLLIVGVLGGGYIYMKRRKEKMAQSLEDEMKEDDVNHSSPEVVEKE